MKLINYFKSRPGFMFLFSTVIFYIVNNYIWLKLNVSFPTFYYYAFDFKRVIEFYEILKKFNLGAVINQLIHVQDAYIHSLTTALIALIFGKSNIAINLFNNIPYFAIAVFSIYMIAKKISGRFTALLSVAVFSLYPAVYGTSRLYILEFAVMGMVPLCVWYLLNTEEFTDLRYSLLFGLALGWGMLIKYSLGVFIIGPLGYVFIKAIISNLRKRNVTNKNTRVSATLLNIILSALTAMAVMGIKYLNFNNIKSFLERPFYLAKPAEPWHRLNNLITYTLGLSEYQLSLFFFLVLLVAFYGFLSKTKGKIIIVLLSWIIIPWLILVTMPCTNASPHYSIPYLPAMALVSAIGLTNIFKKNKKIQIIVFSLILIVGIVQYYDFSFGFGPNLSKYKIVIKKTIKDELYRSYLFPYYLLSRDICSRPEKDTIYNKVIFSIAQRCDKKVSKVLMLPRSISSCDSPHVWSCIQWFKKLPFKIVALDKNKQFIDEVLVELGEADFILYSGDKKDIQDPTYLDYIFKEITELYAAHFKYKDLEEINQFLDKKGSAFRDNFHRLINQFKLVEVITCEENIYFRLYKKSEVAHF